MNIMVVPSCDGHVASPYTLENSLLFFRLSQHRKTRAF